MKINKLFHWLYGALMCLPLLGVLFTSLYVTFNPNAKDSYSDYTQSNYIEVTNNTPPVSNYYQINYYNNGINNGSISFDVGKNDLNKFANDTSLIVNHFFLYANDSYLTRLQLFFTNGTNQIINNWQNISTSFTFYLANVTSFNNANGLISMAKMYREYYTFDSLDNVFTYAVNDINNNPLYNWAQDSFLVAPIAFVTSLFGLTQTSPVVTLLSYWLTISIVWLVFDLIMYVPLLVHRWLDKGVIS